MTMQYPEVLEKLFDILKKNPSNREKECWTDGFTNIFAKIGFY